MSDVARARVEIKKRSKKELVEANIVANVAIGVLAARVAYASLESPCGPDSTDDEWAAERAFLDERTAAVAADALEVAQSIVKAG